MRGCKSVNLPAWDKGWTSWLELPALISFVALVITGCRVGTDGALAVSVLSSRNSRLVIFSINVLFARVLIKLW